ncbi:MAG TPA: WhiB family transcriptional regulator [Streptosporangiaceae bacterium]|nr:WhiB family transcriptional regulator [Streptosporangiaceae bacterium]
MTRSKEEARARIRECLAATPGLTAQQVGRALGLRSNAMRTLRAMQYDAEVIAVPEFRPQMGRDVSTWHVAPPGTVPPPRPAPDRAGDARRRARETAAQRTRRARVGGKPAPFSSLQGAAVPTRRLSDPACASADPALFFPPAEYETPPARRRRVRQAANFCGACPARLACYKGAAERLEPWGVWGGVDFTPVPGGRRKAS